MELEEFLQRVGAPNDPQSAEKWIARLIEKCERCDTEHRKSIDEILEQLRAKRIASQLTLGKLIVILKSHRADTIVTGLGTPDSYRGYYSDLAFRPADSCTVAELLEICNNANGQEYYGWKGGEFVMTSDTPLWIAERGDDSGRKLVGLVMNDDGVLVPVEERDDA